MKDRHLEPPALYRNWRYDKEHFHPEDSNRRAIYGRDFFGRPKQDQKVVELLLDRHANVEAKDNNGWTALHVDVAEGYSEIVKTLITKTNTEEKTADGESTSDLASKLPDGRHRDEIMKILGIRTVGNEAGPGGSN